MSNFKFKEFSVKQEASAMKIGTDGVLLGAWVNLDQVYTALDVGTGTGLIGLMIAQRSEADIEAVEIEDAAFEEAVFNFEESPWSDRLFVYHASFQEFAQEMDESYDLIISNPPYFPGSEESTAMSPRQKARQAVSLSFDDLLHGTRELLADDGCFALVLPYLEKDNFIKRAAEFGLYPARTCDVRGRQDGAIVRVMMEFTKQNQETIEESLTIEIQRHQYTEDYTSLVKDFYLKM